MNFLRDLIDASRGCQETALGIADLHPKLIEIKVAPQGLYLDVAEPLRSRIQAAVTQRGFEFTPQVSRLTEETYPASNLYLGYVDEELEHDWFATVESWPTHLGKPPGRIDFLHIESHVMDKRSVFLTRDKPLREMCGLLEAKGHGPIGAVAPEIFLQNFPARP